MGLLDFLKKQQKKYELFPQEKRQTQRKGVLLSKRKNDMMKEYDFSDAVQGKFYAGKGPADIIIHLDTIDPSYTYEIYHDEQGDFHFRLEDQNDHIIVTSNSFASKNECLNAIQLLKQTALVSQTVEV